jgi:hypothetical protein
VPIVNLATNLSNMPVCVITQLGNFSKNLTFPARLDPADGDDNPGKGPFLSTDAGESMPDTLEDKPVCSAVWAAQQQAPVSPPERPMQKPIAGRAHASPKDAIRVTMSTKPRPGKSS